MKFLDHCTLCFSKDIHELDASYRHAWLVKCRQCGFVFSGRIPEYDELIAHYAKYQRGEAISPITVKRYEELLQTFSNKIKGRTILDVGCGNGDFLDVAASKKWNVYGTEFDPIAVDLCKQKKINIFSGTLKDFDLTDQLDVITSFEVMEHINNPDEEIQRIHQLLKPGGLFYFTTPNFNSFSRRFLKGKWNVIEYPEHLSYFSPSVIDNTLRGAGFEKIYLKTTGISIQRFRTSLKNTPHGSTTSNADQSFRANAEKNILLKGVKNLANFILSSTNSGDTIKGLYRKR
ncbi:MAG: hypothetical protein Fur0041_03270 [Bacteroidia bacterium]